MTTDRLLYYLTFAIISIGIGIILYVITYAKWRGVWLAASLIVTILVFLFGPQYIKEETNMKFKKKPVIIEAIQWHGDIEDLKPFIDDGMEYTFTDAKKLWIRTLEGSMCVKENAWVIKGVQGEFYPCQGDIFEETYEAAE